MPSENGPIVEIDLGWILVAMRNGKVHVLTGMHSKDVAFFYRGGAYAVLAHPSEKTVADLAARGITINGGCDAE